jgi:hypothetical protein
MITGSFFFHRHLATSGATTHNSPISLRIIATTVICPINGGVISKIAPGSPLVFRGIDRI